MVALQRRPWQCPVSAPVRRFSELGLVEAVGDRAPHVAHAHVLARTRERVVRRAGRRARPRPARRTPPRSSSQSGAAATTSTGSSPAVSRTSAPACTASPIAGCRTVVRNASHAMRPPVDDDALDAAAAGDPLAAPGRRATPPRRARAPARCPRPRRARPPAGAAAIAGPTSPGRSLPRDGRQPLPAAGLRARAVRSGAPRARRGRRRRACDRRRRRAPSPPRAASTRRPSAGSRAPTITMACSSTRIRRGRGHAAVQAAARWPRRRGGAPRGTGGGPVPDGGSGAPRTRAAGPRRGGRGAAAGRPGAPWPTCRLHRTSRTSPRRRAAPRGRWSRKLDPVAGDPSRRARAAAELSRELMDLI